MPDDQITREANRLAKVPEKDQKDRKKVSGLVTDYKGPLGKRIIGMIFENDLKSVGTSLLYEVAIPKAKDILADLFIGGIERAIYGDSTPRSTRTNYSSGPSRKASYESYYESGRYYGSSISNKKPVVRWDQIVMISRPKAIEVVECLRDDIRKYKKVSVSDLYDYVTDVDREYATLIDSEFTDRDWGWVNLDRVPIEHVNGGYWIKLPKPIQL